MMLTNALLSDELMSAMLLCLTFVYIDSTVSC